MGAISIWHWLILILFVGVPAALCIWTAKRSPAHPDGGPVGFGGWLLLLAMGQTLAPLKTLASLSGTAQSLDKLAAIPGGRIAVGGEVALNLAFLVLQVAVLALMYRRSILFPKFFLYQLLCMIAVIVLDALLVSASLGIAVNQIFTPEMVGEDIVALLGTGLWTLYLFKSRRVKNTFVQGESPSHVVIGKG